MPCLVLSYLVLSCLVFSCLVLSCLVLSCLVLSCLVLLSRLVLSYALCLGLSLGLGIGLESVLRDILHPCPFGSRTSGIRVRSVCLSVCLSVCMYVLSVDLVGSKCRFVSLSLSCSDLVVPFALSMLSCRCCLPTFTFVFVCFVCHVSLPVDSTWIRVRVRVRG
jgi:hypothetical protein